MGKKQPEGEKNGSEVSRWRQRIVGHDEVPASSLTPHPGNFRLHPDTQRAAVAEAISRIGWIEEVLVNKTTGHLLNGHLRVELTVQEEKLALASLDPLGSLAVEDADKLGDLLADMDLGTSALDTLLSTAAHDAAITRLFKDAEADDDGKTGPRLPNAGQNITVVLPADDLPLFERAIRATEENNRGKAISILCRSYLDSKGLFTEAMNG